MPRLQREKASQHHLFLPFYTHIHNPTVLPKMTCCAAYVSFPMITPRNDPLKRDRHITMVPRRATQSCKILSVWGLLSQITCPSDVFGPRWRTGYATQQAQQCANVRRMWFMRCESDGGKGEEGDQVCVWVGIHDAMGTYLITQPYLWGHKAILP